VDLPDYSAASLNLNGNPRKPIEAHRNYRTAVAIHSWSLMVDREYQRKNQEMLSRRQADHAWPYFRASEEAALWPP
jgi:hypothetical protein